MSLYVRSSGEEEHNRVLEMFLPPSLNHAAEALDPEFKGGWSYSTDIDFSNLKPEHFDWVGDSVGGTTDGYVAPSKEDIIAKYNELYANWQQKEYARHRAIEYPRIEDQLDMLYHDNLNNTNNWQTLIDTIKSAYPKPAQ